MMMMRYDVWCEIDDYDVKIAMKTARVSNDRAMSMTMDRDLDGLFTFSSFFYVWWQDGKIEQHKACTSESYTKVKEKPTDKKRKLSWSHLSISNIQLPFHLCIQPPTGHTVCCGRYLAFFFVPLVPFIPLLCEGRRGLNANHHVHRHHVRRLHVRHPHDHHVHHRLHGV